MPKASEIRNINIYFNLATTWSLIMILIQFQWCNDMKISLILPNSEWDFKKLIKYRQFLEEYLFCKYNEITIMFH